MGMIPQCDKFRQHTCEQAQREGERAPARCGGASGALLPLYLISLVFLKMGLPSFSSPMSNRSEYSSLFLWSTWNRAQRSAFTRFFA